MSSFQVRDTKSNILKRKWSCFVNRCIGFIFSPLKGKCWLLSHVINLRNQDRPCSWFHDYLSLLNQKKPLGIIGVLLNFIIQELKSKHTSLKKYTNWAQLIYFSLVFREREEKKSNISHLCCQNLLQNSHLERLQLVIQE